MVCGYSGDDETAQLCLHCSLDIITTPQRFQTSLCLTNSITSSRVWVKGWESFYLGCMSWKSWERSIFEAYLVDFKRERGKRERREEEGQRDRGQREQG